MWKERIVVPREKRGEVLQEAHSGHPGIVRTKRLLRETYWWPGMAGEVDHLVKHCGPCQWSEKSNLPPPSKGYVIPQATSPGAQWDIDITGPFYNGRFLIVAIDNCSKFPEVLDTKSISSETVINWLSGVFARYGNPDAVLTDNGTQFVSKEFRDFLKSLDIHHYTSPVYHPRENGRVEAFNKVLKQGIQTFTKDTPWTQALRRLLKKYRLTPNGRWGESSTTVSRESCAGGSST